MREQKIETQKTATAAEDAAKRIIEAERAKQAVIENTWAIQRAYANFLKAMGLGEGAPEMALPPISLPYVPPNAPPEDNHAPGTGRGATHMPVPGRTIGSLSVGGGGGGGYARGGSVGTTVVIDMSGMQNHGSTQEMTTERYWYKVGDAAVKGIRSRMRDAYGIDVLVGE